MFLTNKIIEFIVRSNIFLALCAAASCFNYQVFQPAKPEALLFLAASTLLVYNTHNLVKSKLSAWPKNNPKQMWVQENSNRIITICFLSMLTIVGICITQAIKLTLAASWAGLIAIFYTIPFYKSNGKRLALRNLPYSKAIFVALVWTYATVMLPLFFIEVEFNWSDPYFWIFFAGRFLLFYLLSSITDIKDLGNDAPEMQTLPQLFGIVKSKQIYALLLVGVIISGILCWENKLLTTATFLGFCVGNVVLIFFIINANKTRGEYYYSIGTDGILLIQFIAAQVLAVLLK